MLQVPLDLWCIHRQLQTLTTIQITSFLLTTQKLSFFIENARQTARPMTYDVISLGLVGAEDCVRLEDMEAKLTQHRHLVHRQTHV